MGTVAATISATNGTYNIVASITGTAPDAATAEGFVTAAKNLLTSNGFTITQVLGQFTPNTTGLT